MANSAKTDPRMWEAIGNIPKASYEGQDQAYNQKMRDTFSDSNGGLPLDATLTRERLGSDWLSWVALPALMQPRSSQYEF